MIRKLAVLAVLVLPVSFAPTAASAQSTQDKLKMKSVEDSLAHTLENHVNSDALTGGINAPICEPADSLAEKPCKSLPKAQWAHVTASVDWASFKGKIDEEHGYDEVQEKCERVVMSLNWLSNQGSRAEKNAYQKAAREQIKSIRCRFDAKASNAAVLDLKGGVFTAGFNWGTGAEGSLDSAVGGWLMKKL